MGQMLSNLILRGEIHTKRHQVKISPSPKQRDNTDQDAKKSERLTHPQGAVLPALEKAGFVKEAHLVENEFYDGQFLDTVIYSILNK